VDWIAKHFNWFLCICLVITRLIDILTTYIVTPKLKLETNPIIKKWGPAWLTMALCVIPFFSIPLAIIVLVMSLLSSANNIRKVWMLKAIGEEQYYSMTKQMIQKHAISKILVFECISTFFWISIGLLLIFIIGFNTQNQAFWFGLGIGSYGVLILLYSLSYLIKIKKKPLQKPSPGSTPGR
jgi:hypothetical protein